MDNENLVLEDHHVQQELCQSRPAYRQGRKLTAIKVYTVNSESTHLFLYGVPSINLRPELKNLCTKYGQINNLHVVTTQKTEQFTECYHVCYQRIQSARIAKRFLDNRSFYGGVLHVCYAPEYETIADTRMKLNQRKRDVLTRVIKMSGDTCEFDLNYTPFEKIDDDTDRNNFKKRNRSFLDDESDPLTHSFKRNKTSAIQPAAFVTSVSMPVYKPDINDFRINDYSETRESNNQNSPLVPSVVIKNSRQEKRVILKNKSVSLL